MLFFRVLYCGQPISLDTLGAMQMLAGGAQVYMVRKTDIWGGVNERKTYSIPVRFYRRK